MKKIVIIPLIVILFVFVIILTYLYTGNYKSNSECVSYLNNSENVNVSKIKKGYFFDGPGEETGIIFFPGAKIEYTAYAKLMNQIAENGKDCFLLKMPFNLSFFDIYAPKEIINEYNYENWYLSGHSLGGAMACVYTSNQPEKVKGIIALAAYPSKELPSNIRYI